MSWSDPNNVVIGIDIQVETNNAEEKISDVKKAVSDSGGEVDKQAGSWKELSGRIKEAGEEYQVESAPIRSISWDLLLTGRSLSVMNTSLLGNNQSFKQMIGLIYSAAAAIRLLVMAYDAQRISAEMAAKTGYLSSHNMPIRQPFDIGSEIRSKKGSPPSTGAVISNVAKTVQYATPTVTVDEPSVIKPVAEQIKVIKDKPAFTEGLGFASRYAQSAAKRGIIQPLNAPELERIDLNQENKSKEHKEGIFSSDVVGGIMTAIQLGALFLEQGGVVQKNQLAYVHQGEAVVREKDFHAVNDILQSFQQPLKTGTQGAMPSVNLPGKNSTTNNDIDDIRNFINIDFKTGPISSNVNVNDMLKKLSQQMVTSSRRYTGQ